MPLTKQVTNCRDCPFACEEFDDFSLQPDSTLSCNLLHDVVAVYNMGHAEPDYVTPLPSCPLRKQDVIIRGNINEEIKTATNN